MNGITHLNSTRQKNAFHLHININDSSEYVDLCSNGQVRLYCNRPLNEQELKELFEKVLKAAKNLSKINPQCTNEKILTCFLKEIDKHVKMKTFNLSTLLIATTIWSEMTQSHSTQELQLLLKRSILSNEDTTTQKLVKKGIYLDTLKVQVEDLKQNRITLASVQPLLEAGLCFKELFFKAIKAGRKDIVSHLIQQGIDINAILKNNTALKKAASFNQFEIIDILLKNKANPYFYRPAIFYTSDQQCADLLKEQDKEGISEYLFLLKCFSHLFQIPHELENFTLSNMSLEGMPSTAPPPQNSQKKTKIKIYSYLPLLKEFFSFLSPEYQKMCASSFEEIPKQLELSSQELANHYHQGNGIVVYTQWKGHCTWMWIEGNLIFHCNSGRKSKDKSHGITIYSLPNSSKITENVIQKLRSKDREYIEHGIVKALDLTIAEEIVSKKQKGNFCAIRSFLLLLKGVVMLKKAQTDPQKSAQTPIFNQEAALECRKAKEAMEDLYLKKLLDVYEKKDNSFQPELSLLLMTLAKLPSSSLQKDRLIDFLYNHQCPIDALSNRANFFHYLKGENQYENILRLFEEKAVQTVAPQLLQAFNAKGQTPLIQAIQENRLASIALLLKLGANPHQPNKQGELPLIKAHQIQQEEVIQLLLDHGANLSVRVL